MGYFSNGTEGDMYEAKYCNRCRHEDDEKGCPVMLLHVIWNYEVCNPKTDEHKAMHDVLEMLIPRGKDGFNDQCSMFIAREEN